MFDAYDTLEEVQELLDKRIEESEKQIEFLNIKLNETESEDVKKTVRSWIYKEEGKLEAYNEIYNSVG